MKLFIYLIALWHFSAAASFAAEGAATAAYRLDDSLVSYVDDAPKISPPQSWTEWGLALARSGKEAIFNIISGLPASIRDQARSLVQMSGAQAFQSMAKEIYDISGRELIGKVSSDYTDFLAVIIAALAQNIAGYELGSMSTQLISSLAKEIVTRVKDKMGVSSLKTAMWNKLEEAVRLYIASINEAKIGAPQSWAEWGFALAKSGKDAIFNIIGGLPTAIKDKARSLVLMSGAQAFQTMAKGIYDLAAREIIGKVSRDYADLLAVIIAEVLLNLSGIELDLMSATAIKFLTKEIVTRVKEKIGVSSLQTATWNKLEEVVGQYMATFKRANIASGP